MAGPKLPSIVPKIVMKYQNAADSVLATFVKPIIDGGENRSPGAANLRGFVFF